MKTDKDRQVVLIMSGGLDSTTLLYRLLSEDMTVEALSFNYGQRHLRELKMAEKTCRKYGVPHKIVNMQFLGGLLDQSALTGKIKVPHGHYESENMKSTVVPNRNMILLSIAIGRAVNIGAGEVAIGVHAGDHAIYPDCRPAFVDVMDIAGRISNYKPVVVSAPYINKSKADIIAEGIKLGVDYSLTWTCYEGKLRPCGKCGSCVERAEAFAINKIKDPLCK
jgi:7-cyano-7-deazaguanine synthase